MAEEIPRGPEPHSEAGPQDDVLGKIHQLLNRHRPKASAAETIPVLTAAPRHEEVPIGDGIPVLTDVVAGTGQRARPAPLRSRTISSVMILRRMTLALDAEHARLLAQIGGDAAQARLLDWLVAELKHALPAAVRAAIIDKAPDPARPGEDARL